MGNTLKVTTTHLKDGYLKRGGPQTSDMYSMTEYITRHDDILTIVTVVDDPIYLDEPYVQSTTYVYDPTASVDDGDLQRLVVRGERRDRSSLGAALSPGQNSGIDRVAARPRPWIPSRRPLAAAVRRRSTPSTASTLDGDGGRPRRQPDGAHVALGDFGAKAIADQSPRDGEVHVLPVQGNIYMLVADGTNITASIGPEGVAARQYRRGADVGQGPRGDQSAGQDGRGRTSANTCVGAKCPGAWGWSSPVYQHRHQFAGPGQGPFATSSTPAWRRARRRQREDRRGRNLSRGGGFGGAVGERRRAPVVAHENVLNRMSAPAAKQPAFPQAAWPTDHATSMNSTSCPRTSTAKAIIVYHAPAANTDGDSIV